VVETADEAAAFLNDVMGLGLSPEDVAALEERSGGRGEPGSHRRDHSPVTGRTLVPKEPRAIPALPQSVGVQQR
jgi:hypothetical protein